MHVAAEQDIIPIFPLGHVLMPGCPLPLRIFEPRYRALLADVQDEGGRGYFGVVALLAGSEVGPIAATHLATVGTIAEVLEVHPAPDGTSSILTGGTRRFRVDEVLDRVAPYLKAVITYLDEPAGDMPPGLPDAAKTLSAEYARLLAALTRERGNRDPYNDDDILLSYQLATAAPVSIAEHQRLLEAESAAKRLATVHSVLRREVILLRETRTIAVSPAVLSLALPRD